MKKSSRPDRKAFEQVAYEQHVERLKHVKCCIDTRQPRKKPVSRKWEQEKQRQYKNIQFDNAIILDRLTKVQHGKKIDNQLEKYINFHRDFMVEIREKKKREHLTKIANENMALLRNVQRVESSYNLEKWKEEEKKRETLKCAMTLYPEFYHAKDRSRLQKEERRKMKRMGIINGQIDANNREKLRTPDKLHSRRPLSSGVYGSTDKLHSQRPLSAGACGKKSSIYSEEMSKNGIAVQTKFMDETRNGNVEKFSHLNLFHSSILW